ncbi:MAG: hypothetical protein ABI809_14030, partial [Caldimonas sp.]
TKTPAPGAAPARALAHAAARPSEHPKAGVVNASLPARGASSTNRFARFSGGRFSVPPSGARGAAATSARASAPAAPSARTQAPAATRPSVRLASVAAASAATWHAPASAAPFAIARARAAGEAPKLPEPLPTAPAAAPVAAPNEPPVPRDLVARAGELMASQIPRAAQRAERLVLRVLFVASHADAGTQDDEVRNAASLIRLAPADPALSAGASASDARALSEAARTAFFRRGSAQEALNLQTRAFGANPLDPEVVGNLAFMQLRQQPPQVEVARELALHALTLHDVRYPQGRIEDWTTFAIASALAGRERDARNAWLVTLALAPSVERQCRAAINAYALYGERLRAPVEAMLHRVHATERTERSALCEWPPHWTTASQTR